jgi:hypothetical protein
MAIFGSNPNKDYSQQGSITGGYENTYKVNPGPIGGVNIYKTKNGTRGLHGMDGGWYEKEAGSGKFYKSSGRDWVQVEDYNSKPKEEPKPKSSSGGGSSGGGGNSGGNSGDRTPNYGTTNPQPGNTGSQGLDATTKALMDMVTALTASIANIGSTPAADAADVSAPAADAGIGGTVLGGGYDATKEKKKKSYLTPISVG